MDAALCVCLDATNLALQDGLFMWLMSLKSCSKCLVPQVSFGVINATDLRKDLEPQYIRKFGASLDYPHCYSVDYMVHVVQWISPFSFQTHYLQHHIEDVPCGTMGSLPTPSSLHLSIFFSLFLPYAILSDRKDVSYCYPTLYGRNVFCRIYHTAFPHRQGRMSYVLLRFLLLIRDGSSMYPNIMPFAHTCI